MVSIGFPSKVWSSILQDFGKKVSEYFVTTSKLEGSGVVRKIFLFSNMTLFENRLPPDLNPMVKHHVAQIWGYTPFLDISICYQNT